jgi:hypothetical protein
MLPEELKFIEYILVFFVIPFLYLMIINSVKNKKIQQGVNLVVIIIVIILFIKFVILS